MQSPHQFKNVYTSPGWFTGEVSDTTTGVVTVQMASYQGCVKASGDWLAPVHFSTSSSYAQTDWSLIGTSQSTEIAATDAAGNEETEDADVAWCPIIILGRGPYAEPTRIAVQMGDSILVGVTPDRSGGAYIWKWEDDPEVDVTGIDFDTDSGTFADTDDFTGVITHTLADIYSGAPFENVPLNFDLYGHDTTPPASEWGTRRAIYEYGSGTSGPDATATLTTFLIDFAAQKDRDEDTWYLEYEEQDPGIVMGCDDDDDDGNEEIDSKDDFIPFSISGGEGEPDIDITDAVLEDVVELKRYEIRVGPGENDKVTAGTATIRVYAPGAENEFGNVRLMERTDTGLKYCEGNEHTFAVKDIPKDSEPDETYYLQGVTPSVQARDVAVEMEYDVLQHKSNYDWHKIVRDVMWVNVVRIEYLTALSADLGHGEALVPLSNLPISDPGPAVILDIPSASEIALSPDGSMTVPVTGEVFDRLADILPNDVGKIPSVTVKIDDEEFVLGNLVPVSDDASSFLRPFPNRVRFSCAVTVPQAGPVVSIDVETAENAVGQKGKATLLVKIDEQPVSGREHSDAQGNPPIILTDTQEDLNIVLQEGFPDDLDVDIVTVYTGDREPQAGDIQFQEAAQALVFEGDAVGTFQVTRIAFLDFDELRDDAKDSFRAEVTGDEGNFVAELAFTETDVDTRRFVARFGVSLTPDFNVEGVMRTIGAVDAVHAEDRNRATDPYFPVVAAVTGAEEMLAEYHGEVNGEEFQLGKVRAGDDRMFFALDGDPAVFCFVPGGSSQADAPNLIEVLTGQEIVLGVHGSPGPEIKIPVSSVTPAAVPFQDNTNDSAQLTLTIAGEGFPANLQVKKVTAPGSTTKIHIVSQTVNAARTQITVTYVIRAGTLGGTQRIVLSDTAPNSKKTVHFALQIVRVEFPDGRRVFGRGNPLPPNLEAVVANAVVKMYVYGFPKGRGSTYSWSHHRAVGAAGTFRQPTKRLPMSQLFYAPAQRTATKGSDELRVEYIYRPRGGGAAVTVTGIRRLDIVEPASITLANAADVGLAAGSPVLMPWQRQANHWYATRLVYFRLRDHFGDPINARNDRDVELPIYNRVHVGVKIHIYETFARPLYGLATLIPQTSISSHKRFKLYNKGPTNVGLFRDTHSSAFNTNPPQGSDALVIESARKWNEEVSVGGSIVYDAAMGGSQLTPAQATQTISVRILDPLNNDAVLWGPLDVVTGNRLVRMKGPYGDLRYGVGLDVVNAVVRE